MLLPVTRLSSVYPANSASRFLCRIHAAWKQPVWSAHRGECGLRAEMQFTRDLRPSRPAVHHPRPSGLSTIIFSSWTCFLPSLPTQAELGSLWSVSSLGREPLEPRLGLILLWAWYVQALDTCLQSGQGDLFWSLQEFLCFCFWWLRWHALVFLICCQHGKRTCLVDPWHWEG